MKAAKQLVGTFNIDMKNGLDIKTELLNYMRMWRFLDSKTVVKLTLTHTQRKSQTHLVSMMKWTHTWVHANKICKMNEKPHIISAHIRSSTECDKTYLNKMHFLYCPLNEQRAAFANACVLKNVIVLAKSSKTHWSCCCSVYPKMRMCSVLPVIHLHVSSEFFLWSPQK